MRMKRLLAALFCVLAVAAPALAFDSAPAPVTIGILRFADTVRYDAWVEKAVLETLRNELREKRFDAFLLDATFAEIEADSERNADYYVEIASDSETADYGGVGVVGRHADVTLGMLVSRMAAEVRVYKGRSLELVAKESLNRRSKAFVPTSVGLGGRHVFAVIGLAWIERAQVRSVARGVGREIADVVADAVRPE